jgi:uncharacterized protein YbjT (DUF2867 family)
VNVAIAGGHGKIGLKLTRLLREGGDRVVSLIREPEQAEDILALDAEPIVCDLETADVVEVAEAINGMDAVVFAAGAGPGSGPERKETMDYGGAVRLIEAAKAREISRYLMISSMGADPNASGEDTFAAYQRAKGRADAELEGSGLDYTIVRPGSLTDDPGTGKVGITHEDATGESIPRDDVAAVLAACLNAPNTVGKTFGLLSGNVPIEEAIGSL